MFGTYRLSFGGETTAVLSVFSAADEILAALEAIPSIGEGSVAVTGLLNDQTYNKTSGGGISEVHYGISFRDALVGNVGTAPQNFGPLPMVVELVALDGITGDGLAASSTERRCGGQYASGYDYAEQLVTVTPLALGGNLTELAAAGARFTLALNGSTGTTDAEDCATRSDALAPGGADAAPAALTSALLAIGGGLTDKDIQVFPNVTSASELSFIVRFLHASEDGPHGLHDARRDADPARGERERQPRRGGARADGRARARGPDADRHGGGRAGGGRGGGRGGGGGGGGRHSPRPLSR